jgi:hypothetical protein
MAGLEPARAFYGPTDFKSVASAISPHRRGAMHFKLVIRPAKMNFATSGTFEATCTRIATMESVSSSVPMKINRLIDLNPAIRD